MLVTRHTKRTGKVILLVGLTLIMMLILCADILAGNMKRTEAAIVLNNPQINSDGVITYDCVWFGHYPQSDAAGQKEEPIKWRVLSVDGDDAFLMADTNLDVKKYNDRYKEITWETCTMRSWLNGYGSGGNKAGKDYSDNNFIDHAFTALEQDAIQESELVNEDNPINGIEGGSDTKDKVFLLSYDEVTNPDYGFSSDYSKFDPARTRKNTAYVAAGGTIGTSTMYSEGSMDWWWLRSPGDFTQHTMYVYSAGALYPYGYHADYYFIAVCPALHLNLSAVDVWSYAGTVSTNGESTEGDNPPE